MAKWYRDPDTIDMEHPEYSNLDPLSKLAYKHRTDKRPNRHGYTPQYHKLLSDKKIDHFLEIGCYNGGSHAMWLEYFPEAMIYGIDLDDLKIRKTSKVCKFNPRLVLVEMDQSNRKKVSKWADSLGVSFDVVLDDGSHRVSHQIASFEALWQFVSPGGVYIVEDIFTSYWADSSRGYLDQEETCIEYFKKFIDEIILQGRQIVKGGYSDFEVVKKHRKMTMIEETVESIQFCNGFLVVYRR